jgi:6-phosphofructokinase 1
MVLEVMGRHAGWIALHSGIAGGGDVILLPEIPWTFESICRKVRERESEGKKYTLIVVAEGANLPDVGLVYREDVNGPAVERRHQVKLGGVGERVAAELTRLLDREVRTVVLGHLQRGGNPTTFDRLLATEFGAHAVRLIHQGHYGQMVCYRPPSIESVPIVEAIRTLSRVDPCGSAVQAARALGIGFGDAADLASPFAHPCVDPCVREASSRGDSLG